MKTMIAIFILGTFALMTCKLRSPEGSTKSERESHDSINSKSGITVHGLPVSKQQKEELLASMKPSRSSADEGMIAKTKNSEWPQSDSSVGLSLQESALSYIDRCTKAGVPIPPNWADTKSWKFEGALSSDRIFALESHLITELYSFQTSKGGCAALPRMYTSREIKALGIICQGISGGACFWDNIDPVTKEKITDPAKIQPKLMSDGSNLKENCSECHRGSDAFIVHVGTVLEKIPKRELTNKYIPLGQKNWGNPIGNAEFAPNCQGCHTLPQLNLNYCVKVLLPSIHGSKNSAGLANSPTMPPKDLDRADYAADIKQIDKACREFSVD